MKFPGVVAVLCVVPSGLVLNIGITLCTFPPWTEMSKKNDYEHVLHNHEIFRRLALPIGSEMLPDLHVVTMELYQR